MYVNGKEAKEQASDHPYSEVSGKVIMHLVASSYFGGPEKQILSHLKLLNKAGASGIAASFVSKAHSPDLISKANQFDIPTSVIRAQPRIDVASIIRLCREIRFRKVDLLCAHGYKAVVLGRIATLITGRKLLAFSRGYTEGGIKTFIYQWLDQKFLPLCDGVVCVSQGQKDRLTELGVKLDDSRTWIVRNAVDVVAPPIDIEKTKNLLRLQLRVPQTAVLAICAGRFSSEKGHSILLAALRTTKESNLPLVCLICGDGPLKSQLMELSEKLGIQECCRFLGFRKDLGDLIAASDFMILPSLSEGLPNVLLEAFAAGKPVVSTRVGGVPEVVSHGANGLLVDPRNSKSLAQAIMQITKDERMRTDMGKTAYSLIADRFSFAKQNRELLDIYSSLLNPPSKNRISLP